jgi:large repetitive protein
LTRIPIQTPTLAMALATIASGGCTLSDDSLFLASSANLLAGEADYTLIDPAGWTGATDDGMAVVGDLDGDGLDDLVVFNGSHHAAGEEWARGAVRVVYGAAGRTGDVEIGDPVLELDDPFWLTHSGAVQGAVSAAGDVDGDGYADFLVAQLNDVFCAEHEIELPETSRRATTFLVHGGPDRLAGSQRIADVATAIRDSEECTGLGARLAGLGDLDGDGYADFGLPTWRWPLSEDGYSADPNPDPDSFGVHVFHGSPDRLPGEVGPDAAQATLRGGQHLTAAPAGDVDGDGRADLLVHGPSSPAHLLLGSADRLSGEVDVADAASTRFEGGHDGIAFGAVDLDGDGRSELALMGDAAEGDDFFHLFHGREGAFPPVVSLADADAVFLRPVDLVAGTSSSFAGGDRDGDGYVDLAIGDPGLAEVGANTYGLQNRGGVLVVPGTGERFTGPIELDRIGQRLLGTIYQDTCEGESGGTCVHGEGAGFSLEAGDLDGDGRSDLVVSGRRLVDEGGEYDNHHSHFYVVRGQGDEG